MSTYRQQAIEDVAKDNPACIGYPGCDGDLVGFPHEPGCPLFGKPEPDIHAYAVAQRERVLELEAALRASEWQEIREGNLPKAGDEVWSATQNQYIPHGDMLLRNGVYVVEEPTVMISYYRKLKFTHFRPVNAPSAACAKEGK